MRSNASLANRHGHIDSRRLGIDEEHFDDAVACREKGGYRNKRGLLQRGGAQGSRDPVVAG